MNADMNVQVMSIDHKPVTTAKDFTQCLFLIAKDETAYIVRFTNDNLSDFTRIHGYSWFGQAMKISNEEVVQNTSFCTESYHASIQAFKSHIGVTTASDGWSLESCSSFSEDGLSPRDEAVIGHNYISIFCDENANDDKCYIVSVTPLHSTLDGFDYNKVESVNFTKYAWYVNKEDALKCFKSFCLDAIEAI